MINRVIFLVSVKFNQRDYTRFGIDIFNQYQIPVSIWDITSLVYPRYYEHYQVPDPKHYDNLVDFKDFDSLNEAFSNLDQHSLVIDFNRCFEVVDQINTFNNFKKALLIINLNPYYSDLSKVQQKQYSNLKLSFFEKLELKLAYYFPTLFEPKTIEEQKSWVYNKAQKNEYDIVAIGGANARKKFHRHKIAPTAKIISIHTLDYDLMLPSHPPVNDLKSLGNYAVFLDEAVTTHPDFLRDGIDGVMSFCDMDIYFEELNKTLDIIEEKFKLRVIIASHPRVDYKMFGDKFKGREIFFGQTSELVKKSNLVIGHSSTSMNFAVISQKPILYIDSDNYNQKLRDKIHVKSYLLNYKPYLASRSLNNLEFPEVDLISYKNYIQEFIKERGTDVAPFWKVFCDHIN